jgi:anti-anti-sigma factor
LIVRRRELDGVVVLELDGEYFGGLETQELERALAHETAAGHALLVLDLAACRAMNSTAFGVLIEAHHACERLGGVIKLCGAHGRVRSLLDVVHAQSLFEIHPGEAEALASFASRATA